MKVNRFTQSEMEDWARGEIRFVCECMCVLFIICLYLTCLISFLTDCFYFMYVSVYLNVCIYITCMIDTHRGLNGESSSPGAGVTEGCVLSYGC